MKQVLAAALFLFTISVYANGPDQWELFGISSSGKEAHLTLADWDLIEKSDGTYIYVGPKEYGLCEPASIDNEYYVLCAPEYKSEPNLIYKKNKDEEKTKLYEKAKELYFKHHKRIETGESFFTGYYQCVTGCNSSVADILVEFSYGD